MDQTIYERVHCNGQVNGRRCKRNTLKYADKCFQHAQKAEGVAIKKSEIPGAGNGLFATKDLPAHKKIRYGRPQDVIDKKELDERYPGDMLAQYVIKINKNKYVDARSTQAGLGRWVNDKRGTGKRKNVDLGRMNVVTTKKIKKGEELLTDYGNEYFIPGGGKKVKARAKAKVKAKRRR